MTDAPTTPSGREARSPGPAVSRIRRGPIAPDEERDPATYAEALLLFPRLTEQELEVLGNVSVPFPRPVWGDNAILRKLWRLGLIERDEVTYALGDGLPPMQVPVWLMPGGYGVHIAWCEWCAANFDDEGNRVAYAAAASAPTGREE